MLWEGRYDSCKPISWCFMNEQEPGRVPCQGWLFVIKSFSVRRSDGVVLLLYMV